MSWERARAAALGGAAALTGLVPSIALAKWDGKVNEIRAMREYGAAVGRRREDLVTLKKELVHHEQYATRTDARRSLFEYIEVFYNRSRRHSALGGQSPAAVYEAWLKLQSESKLAA